MEVMQVVTRDGNQNPNRPVTEPELILNLTYKTDRTKLNLNLE